MKKALVTSISQYEVKIVTEQDAPDTYAKNLPPGGKDKWQLVQFEDGKQLWQPIHQYTFNTPLIADRTKVKIVVSE